MIKKIAFDKNYIKICLYVLLVIFISIVFEKFIGNIESIYSSVSRFFSLVKKALSPFIYGLFIAYFINPFVRFVENKLFVERNRLPNSIKARRSLSISLAYIVFIGCICAVIAYVLPEITSSAALMKTTLPNNISLMQRNIESYIRNSEYLSQYNINNINDMVNVIFEPLSESFSVFNDIGMLASTVFTSTVSVAGAILNAVLGTIIAFYMLSGKEGFAQYVTKFLYVTFKAETAAKIIDVSRKSNRVFEKFIVGKAIDSTIIGLLFFAICCFIKPPYILLFSVIIGVTNMIPFFGPFIGGIPVVFVTLFYSPSKALLLGFMILALQQFDGYILGPRILGESTGLSALWVIFAILVGGQFFGILGMLFGVPCFAVIKTIFDEMINRRFRYKYESS